MGTINQWTRPHGGIFSNTVPRIERWATYMKEACVKPELEIYDTGMINTAKMLVENRRVYWTFVGYSLMPKYQPVIETREKMIVPVINMTSNVLIRTVAIWLKEQHKSSG